MSYEDGWSAINLEMPKRVPRTEFTAERYHWELLKVVTGINVEAKSPPDVKEKATEAFVQDWNYDILLQALIGRDEFGGIFTNMGHGIYADGYGVERDDDIHYFFSRPEDILAFDPWKVYGNKDKEQLTRLFNEHYQGQCKKLPTLVNTTGIYITLLTGLTYICGWEMLLMAAGIDPEGFGETVNRYAAWIQQYYDALAEADVPVIYSHDDIVWTEGAIFHPDWYRKYIFPNYKRLWQPLIESGKKVIFICDGDYTKFVDDIAACGAHGFWLEIFTDLNYVVDRYGKDHVIIGNGDTRILLLGTQEQIRAEVERCISVGKKCPGYFMSITNHIAPNTPVRNALYYNEVYEELSKR